MRLTDKEYVELKCAYYSGFKYIARHEIGRMELFKELPVRDKEMNGTKTCNYDTWVIGCYPIQDHSLYGEVKLGKYSFVTWENGVWKITDILNSIK